VDGDGDVDVDVVVAAVFVVDVKPTTSGLEDDIIAFSKGKKESSCCL
jgi:hypothetical protein